MIKAEIRFKNATLMNALEESQYKSIAELSRVSGIKYHTILEIASLRHTPTDTKTQVKLAKLLDCDVYELFEQYEVIVENNKGCVRKLTKDISIDKMLSLSSKEVLQLESDYNTNDTDNQESLKHDISSILNTLKDRERDVIKLHFGMGAEGPLSLDEIAEKFNISTARVGQIKEKSIRRLRHISRTKSLKNYIREKEIDIRFNASDYSGRYSSKLTREHKRINKFQNGTYNNNYKWDCIKKIGKLKVGQSFTVEDRCKTQVQRDWLLNIARYSSRKYKVTSIDKKNQVVTRIL